MRARLLVVVVLPLAAACAGMDSEESLITDSEIAAISSDSLVSGAVSQPVGQVSPVSVRFGWGYLAGKFMGVNHWTNWSGTARIDSGKIALLNTIFFEKHDSAPVQQDDQTLSWQSKTWPHWDGFVARVAPGASGDVLHFATPPFTRDFSYGELAGGMNAVFDAGDGHQVSVSSIPAGKCGGFAFGIEKESASGWNGFGGRVTDEKGAMGPRLRMKANGAELTARLLAPDKTVLGEGKGAHLRDAAGGRFSVELKDASGKSLGVVNGRYDDPSYSRRGAFEAVLTRDCG